MKIKLLLVSLFALTAVCGLRAEVYLKFESYKIKPATIKVHSGTKKAQNKKLAVTPNPVNTDYYRFVGQKFKLMDGSNEYSPTKDNDYLRVSFETNKWEKVNNKWKKVGVEEYAGIFKVKVDESEKDCFPIVTIKTGTIKNNFAKGVEKKKRFFYFPVTECRAVTKELVSDNLDKIQKCVHSKVSAKRKKTGKKISSKDFQKIEKKCIKLYG